MSARPCRAVPSVLFWVTHGETSSVLIRRGRPGHAPGSGQGMTQAARRRKVACPPTYFPRPVATGVDLRTVQERFACLAPGHLAAAVEKIVAAPSLVVRRPPAVVNLRRN